MNVSLLIGTIIWCFVLLQFKHLIIDWIWQPEYEWKNKGTFLHFGGVRHAGKNAIGTGLILCLFFGAVGIPLMILDFTIHYLIDWSKMNINSHYKLTGDKNPEFWWLLGLDQTLHQLTYLLVVYLGVMHWINAIYT